MSAECKARIAATQKKRWAAQKSVASGRSTLSEAATTKQIIKTAWPKSARKVVLATAEKSSWAGKRTRSTQTDTKIAPAKRTAVVAKKSVGKRSATKGTSELATNVPEHNHLVAVNFGIGAIQPHTPAELLADQYGYCKDKHTPLAALLRAKGVSRLRS